MNGSRNFLLAFGIAVLIGAARWIFECKFVAPLMGPDPQIPIWIMFATNTSIAIAVSVFPVAWLMLRGVSANSRLVRILTCLPLLALLGWYSIGFADLARLRAALLDSVNPNTSPDRLRELATFQNGPGYEIDNRIAKHPNTPADVLRSLHGRPDQVGTEMMLATNPNTPDDVLHAIAGVKNEWSEHYSDALKQNPRYDQVFGTAEAPAKK